MGGTGSGRIKFTPTKKRTFLEHLRHNGNISQSARIVGVSRRCAWDHREDDDDFRLAWDDAVEEYIDALEQEADRRGKEGYIKSVYFDAKGNPVELMGYSDTLLMFRLNGERREKYKKNVDHKHDHTVTGTVTIETRLIEAEQQLEALRNGDSYRPELNGHAT